MRRRLLVFSAFGLTSFVSATAFGSDRSFVYTHESRVLAPGEAELEPWTTFRAGRTRYYSAIDARLELEHGLLPGLQASLYYNFSTTTQDVVLDPLTREVSRVTNSEFQSVSAELKYQLSDPTADLVGSALYLEATVGPRESELEGKLIFDRHVGSWLVAANAIAELELEPKRADGESKIETSLWLTPTLGAAYSLTQSASLGIELRAPIGVAGEAESATLFGGPVVRYVGQGFWTTLGAQPQLAAFSGKSPGSRLDLAAHERLEVRLLAGFYL